MTLKFSCKTSTRLVDEFNMKDLCYLKVSKRFIPTNHKFDYDSS